MYAIRLNIVANSHMIGGVFSKISAIVYNNNQQAAASIAPIVQQIENYLNRYDELYPNIQKYDYNNFQFIIDINVPKENNV